MEQTQSECEPNARPTMNKDGENFENNNRGTGRRILHARRRKKVDSVSIGSLEIPKKAQPSFASFYPHQDLLCHEPKVITEVQSSHMETLQDISQQKKQLQNPKSEELKDLKAELQKVSESHAVLLVKAEQLEADLVFERAEVQSLREKLEEKEKEANTLQSTLASNQAQLEENREETRKMEATLKKAEDLLDTDTLMEVEKSRVLFEIHKKEQIQENKTLTAALRNAEEKFERCQAEKTSLMKDIQQEAEEAVERSQASHQDQLQQHSEETRKMAAALKKAEDLLETERLVWQAKNSLLEKSRAFFEAHQKEQNQENKTLTAALRNAEEKFERCQAEKTSLMKDIQQEAEEAVERSQASHQDQLEQNSEETRKMAAALKKAEDLLETERLVCQDKSSRLDYNREQTWLLTQEVKRIQEVLESERYSWLKEKNLLTWEADENREEVRKMAAALKKAERLGCQREKKSLLKSEKSRAPCKVQLEEQNHENETVAAAPVNAEQKKKEKRKWYRRLFCLP